MVTNKIKAILFDMVGVLVFKKPGYLASGAGEINADKIEKLYNHIDDQRLLQDIDRHLHLEKEELEKALFYIPEKYEKFSEIWQLLPELKSIYKMVVINNGNALAKRYWDQKFDFSIFDAFINSALEGVKKPDPKIYLLACREVKTKPENCLFMDDSWENIKTAKSLGMKTIWWNKEEERRKMLERFRVLIF